MIRATRKQVPASIPTDAGARQTVREALLRLSVPAKPARGVVSLSTSDVVNLLDMLRHPVRSACLPWTQLPPV